MFEIRTGSEAMDFEVVHGWLTTSYWSPGISREKIERAARGSSQVIGAFFGERQVGYCRVISDQATFGWLCDVIVDPDFRGKGIGRQMVAHALADPEHQNMRRWALATADAHGVYAALGFTPLPFPERWMHRPGVTA